MAFETVTNWIKNIWEKFMLTRETIKTIFGIDPPTTDVMTRSIELWAKIYANQAPWIKDKEVYSLNLGATIASEVARVVTIESTATVDGTGPRTEFVQEKIDQIMDAIREQAEYGVALGGMIFKPYIDQWGEIQVDYVRADAFFPLDFAPNGEMTSVVFVDKQKVSDFWYTKFEYHKMIENGCIIKNLAYRSQDEGTVGSPIPLTFVPQWANLLPEATILNIDKPLYAYFKNPAANNLDRGSKLGASCYARAINLIEQADKQWSNFLWEFESGQRALYVDELAFGKDVKTQKPNLPNKRLYRTLDAGGSEDALFEDWTPTFRQLDLLAGLDAILRRIEFTTGLAYGTLSNPQSVEKTATEITSAKQRTYALVVDTQKALQNALEQAIWVIDTLATLYNLVPKGTYEVTFDFDDSVIIDKEAQFTKDLQLVSAGIMTKWEWRMRNMNEDEAVAKQKVGDVTVESPPLDTSIAPGNRFGG
jgi:A118 family predicted phage portal protein